MFTFCATAPHWLVFVHPFLTDDRLDTLKLTNMLAFLQDLVMRTEAVSFRRRTQLNPLRGTKKDFLVYFVADVTG